MNHAQLPANIWLSRVRKFPANDSFSHLQLQLLADLLDTCLNDPNSVDIHNILCHDNMVLCCWMLLEGATSYTDGSGQFLSWVSPHIKASIGVSVVKLEDQKSTDETGDKWEIMYPLRKEVNEAIEKCKAHKGLISNIFAHLLSQFDSIRGPNVQLQLNPTSVKIGVIKVSPKELEAVTTFFNAVTFQHAEITVCQDDHETQIQVYVHSR